MSRLSRFIHFYTDEDEGNGGGGDPGILKTVSGALLHITDALAKPAKKFTATLSPVQDLHGQDAPYPAGGGVNKLAYPFKSTTNTNAGITFTDNGDGTVTLNGTATGTATFAFTGDVDYPSGQIISVASFRSGTISNGIVGIYDRVGKLKDLGEGSTVTYENGYTRDIRIDVQQGTVCTNYTLRPVLVYSDTLPTSYTPYSNICPITGHTGANVVRTGKNVFSGGMLHGVWANGAFYTHEGSSTNYFSSAKKISVVGGETYTFSLLDDPTNAWTFGNVQLFAQGAFVKYIFPQSGRTFVVPDGIDEIAIVGNLATAITTASAVSATDFQLELGSTATDYEPYSGTTIHYTFPTLTPNQWDEEWEVGLIDAGNGQNSNNNNYSRTKNYIPIGADTSYWLGFPSGVTIYLRFYDAEKNYLGYSQFNSQREFVASTVSPAFATAAYLRFCWDGQTYSNDISLNYPSTEHSYHPYNRTVYGSTLTYEDGEWKLVVDRAMRTFTGGSDEVWNHYTVASGELFRIDVPDRVSGSVTKQSTNISQYMCNSYVAAANAVAGRINGTFSSGGGTAIDFVNNSYSTVTEWNTYLNSNNIQFVYPLATPTTYTLTESQALTLLKGENNIWVDDSDSLELTYYAKAEETTP